MARVPAPTPTFLGRRRIDVMRVITRDFPLKVAAVLVALVFWIVSILNAAPAEVVRDFGGRVPVERPSVPPGYVLQGQLGDVGVTLRGTEGALAGVAATDLHATLDIGAADLHRADPQDLPVRVTVASAGVKVLDVSPPTVTVRIEPLTSRAAAVQARFANDPPVGTVAGDPAITPSEVRVSGAASKVALITALYATVRFGDAVTDLVTSAQPVAVDAGGATIEGLSVEPAIVQVNVPVLPKATTRTVPVVPAIRGSVASGYWITRITVDPPVVTVRGESGVLGSVDQVATAGIDVSGLTSDRTYQVSLLQPAAETTLVKATQATVTVSVSALVGTRPFPVVTVQASNLGSNLIADIEPATIGLLVAGPLPAILTVTATEVTASVDAAGRGPGSYNVDVLVRLPQGLSAQGVQPTRVTLTIRAR